MKRPKKGTYAPYYEEYLKNIVEENPIKQLESQIYELKAVIDQFDDDTANYAYAEGKWTVKEVLGHLLDTERVISYRAMCIARGETKNLPGFDEKEYVKGADFNRRILSDLMTDYITLRNSTLSLFKSFNEEVFERKGLANDYDITVKALLFIITGHEKHHINILRERYLEKFKK